MSDRYGNPDPIGDIIREIYGADTVSNWFAQANYLASGLPVVGGIFTTVDNHRYYDDYLKNRGMDWSDVKYPARLSAGGYGSALSFVSSNIERLYK